jgi:hypothetical protein
VEIAASHAPHLRVDGEHPAKGRQDSRLAGPVRTEQVRHRLEVNEAHDSPAVNVRVGHPAIRRVKYRVPQGTPPGAATEILLQNGSQAPKLEDKEQSAGRRQKDAQDMT